MAAPGGPARGSVGPGRAWPQRSQAAGAARVKAQGRLLRSNLLSPWKALVRAVVPLLDPRRGTIGSSRAGGEGADSP